MDDAPNQNQSDDTQHEQSDPSAGDDQPQQRDRQNDTADQSDRQLSKDHASSKGGALAAAGSMVANVNLRHGLTIAAMSLLVIVLLYVILQEMSEILIPLLVAVFLCYLIIPAHHWLVRRHIPSLIAYILIIGTFIAVTYVVGNAAYSSIRELTAQLPTHAKKLQNVTTRHVDELRLKVENVFREEEDVEEPEEDETEAFTVALPKPEAEEEDAKQPEDEKPKSLLSGESITSFLTSSLETIVGFFTSALVVLFYVIFLLAEEASFEKRVVGAFGQQRAKKIMEVTSQINVAVARYIAVKTFVSALVASVTFTVLVIYGVQYAVVWGVLTFFANFIPYVGSLAAVMLPIAMSFVQFDNIGTPIMIGILLVTAQIFTGSILEPRLIGEKLGVSPLIILLSLAFWGYLWGVPGMILSAPLVVTVKIILEHMDSTRPLARLSSNI